MADQTRTTAITSDVVQSLRQVIERHRVSPEEFSGAVAFLRGAAQAGELELMSAVLFEAAVDAAAEHEPGTTPTNVEGPFYRPGAPLLAAEGTPTLPMRPDEPGEPLVFSGSVRSVDGRPLPSAELDIWQADNAGDYSQFAPGLPEWNLRGRVRADDAGRFRFRAVVPAPYDIPNQVHTDRVVRTLGLQPRRPAHVHLKITADGHRDLTTQVYFTGDPWLDQDVTGAAVPALATELRADPDGGPGQVCTFDVVLAPAGEPARVG